MEKENYSHTNGSTAERLSVTKLSNKLVDWKTILKKEGNIAKEDSQFQEWWDVFELTRLCALVPLSELEKWCVLRGRFKLVREPSNNSEEKNTSLEERLATAEELLKRAKELIDTFGETQISFEINSFLNK